MGKLSNDAYERLGKLGARVIHYIPTARLGANPCFVLTDEAGYCECIGCGRLRELTRFCHSCFFYTCNACTPRSKTLYSEQKCFDCLEID